MDVFNSYVQRQAAKGLLVVQPRMGFAQPPAMRDGLAAVQAAAPGTAGTITVDAYTRVGQEDRAAEVLARGGHLNGYPISVHEPEITQDMLQGLVGKNFPVQVRHGSADPRNVFRGAAACGLFASEGGPVSYTLPYSRQPLLETAKAWRLGASELADAARKAGLEAHLEAFGGCMYGQQCPPGLLIALSILEALCFAETGVQSVSLSLAQGSSPAQDIGALKAMRALADEYLEGKEFHLVFYSFMGLFPETREGSQALIEDSARIAVLGGAERLIVKTAAEARGIPTIEENVEALVWARQAADDCDITHVDTSETWQELLKTEARTLIEATLALSNDPFAALVEAFDQAILDVPYALHPDNAGLTRAALDTETGALTWASTGKMPLPNEATAQDRVGACAFHKALSYVRDRYDSAGCSMMPASQEENAHA